MPPNSVEPRSEIAPNERVTRIRSVLESDADGLFRVIAVKIKKVFNHLHRPEIAELAYEILDETARRALARPETLDLTRSAFAWLVGIAVHILQERLRDVANERRQVTVTDLGEEVWATLLGQLHHGALDNVISDTLDMHEALGRLDPGSRNALDCQYFRGLGGEDLAKAIGAPNAGAARVRVFRALQRLRDQLGVKGPEVSS